MPTGTAFNPSRGAYNRNSHSNLDRTMDNLQAKLEDKGKEGKVIEPFPQYEVNHSAAERISNFFCRIFKRLISAVSKTDITTYVDQAKDLDETTYLVSKYNKKIKFVRGGNTVNGKQQSFIDLPNLRSKNKDKSAKLYVLPMEAGFGNDLNQEINAYSQELFSTAKGKGANLITNILKNMGDEEKNSHNSLFYDCNYKSEPDNLSSRVGADGVILSINRNSQHSTTPNAPFLDTRNIQRMVASIFDSAVAHAEEKEKKSIDLVFPLVPFSEFGGVDRDEKVGEYNKYINNSIVAINNCMRLHQRVNSDIDINMTLVLSSDQDEDIEKYSTAIDESNHLATIVDSDEGTSKETSINKYFNEITTALQSRKVREYQSISPYIPQSWITRIKYGAQHLEGIQYQQDDQRFLTTMPKQMGASHDFTDSYNAGAQADSSDNDNFHDAVDHDSQKQPFSDQADNSIQRNSASEKEKIEQQQRAKTVENMMLDHINNSTKPTDDEQHEIADVFVNYKGEGDKDFYRLLPLGLTLTTYGEVQNKIYHAGYVVSLNEEYKEYPDRRKYYIGKPVIKSNYIPPKDRVQSLRNKDGVLGAVRKQLSKDPSLKIAVGVCGNSGQPAGGLVMQAPDNRGLLVKKDWSFSRNKRLGQEEGIMREVLPLVYMDHHKSTGKAKNLWKENSQSKRQEVVDGLFKIDGTPVQGLLDCSTSTNTVQGVDYSKNMDTNSLALDKPLAVELTQKYGTAYVLENVPIDNKMTKRIDLVTVASACCNKSRDESEIGSMTRTFDEQAAQYVGVRDETIQEALRAFFDTCVQQEKTHVQVPRVGTGIYDNKKGTPDSADNHFERLLAEVLDEEVGENGEKRYQYFEGIYITSFSK